MSEAPKPSVYTIAAHGGFADALAQGLIDRFGKSEFGLARGLVILPNNRARVAVQEAFVRKSSDGLLLPQMAVIGDLDLDEAVGTALDRGMLAHDINPAVDPLDRLLVMASLIETESKRRKETILARDALRLAREFARTLDQLTAEEIPLDALVDLEVAPELSGHWEDSLSFFRSVAEQWNRYLTDRQLVDEATRRNALFDSISASWAKAPPNHFVVAAGITTSAPAIACFLKTVAFLPSGMVVLPELDLNMAEEEWRTLGPFKPDPETGFFKQSQETHPQYHLKLLLERMSIARAEVSRWPRVGESGALAKRSRALGNAFAVPDFTARWRDLDQNDRSLTGVSTVEARDNAEEAQIVALLAREALEEKERRVAIVTPDRQLATRISAHLKRWGITAEDTAGQPLSKLPEGVLLLTLLQTLADNFSPALLVALLKHPLVQAGEGRVEWLANVRRLDLLLRGPRPSPGLSGIDQLLGGTDKRTEAGRTEILPWWQSIRGVLAETEASLQQSTRLSDLLPAISELMDKLSNGSIWSGPAGRALGDLFVELQRRSPIGPARLNVDEMPGYFENFLENISVRPPYGGHPRISIYGLLEARLQQAELTICAGLNEGVWPQAVSPDPWLAPVVRKSLGLPAQERQTGLSAHDLIGAMGAKHVVLTRSRRDPSGPAIASRFLLRLRAMCGSNLKPHQHAVRWAEILDKPSRQIQIKRPAPVPNADQRRVPLSVTEVERLIADPFAFYARKILRLQVLDSIDAEPGPAWRGSTIHAILDQWAREDDYEPDALKRRAQAFLDDRSSHALMRTLWAPRLVDGLRWIADEITKNRARGRVPLASEIYGTTEIDGILLSGIADRIDRTADGDLAIVDYKTGSPPSNRAVKKGFNLQLGLLGLIAQNGGFKDIAGEPTIFEYWSLAKKDDSFGYVGSPTKGTSATQVPGDEMIEHATKYCRKALHLYVLGDEPMTAKLHPEYSPYADYDQLMRLEEWYGRSEGDATEAADG